MTRGLPTRRRVVKVGGSLLENPGVATELPRWLAGWRRRRPDEQLVVLVGGGGAVQWLREVEARSGLQQCAAHWAAIRMMDANTTAAASWLPDAATSGDWPPPPAPVCLYRVEAFLSSVEPDLPGERLPVGWEATSDSIAARLAAAVGGGLTLVKSRNARTPTDTEGWRRLARSGFVDAFFPRAAAGLADISLASFTA